MSLLRQAREYLMQESKVQSPKSLWQGKLAYCTIPANHPEAFSRVLVTQEKPMFREGSIEEEEGRETFCPLLVVRDPQGVYLDIHGHVTQTVQQEIILVTRNTDPKAPEREPSLRIFFAEGGSSQSQHGILLESVHSKANLALLSTKDVHSEGATGDCIPIYQPPHFNVKDKGVFGKPYAYVVKDPTGIVHMRYKETDGPLLMSVRMDVTLTCANVIRGNGELAASVNNLGKFMDAEGSRVYISQDMDAALVLLAVVATFKLGGGRHKTYTSI